MPWIQLNALITNKGVDNPDGAIAIVLACIALGISISQLNKEYRPIPAFIVLGLLVNTKEYAYILLNQYEATFRTDLIAKLKSINASYEAIEKNLNRFIDLGIVYASFPHERITQDKDSTNTD
jgi:hypothetical protein